MTVIDNIQAWQVDSGDLVQFDTGEYTEIMSVIDYWIDSDECEVRLFGESLVTGDHETHTVDYYLDLEIMGA